ncbi:unnamed protein product, partial [marine sediment metagenome]
NSILYFHSKNLLPIRTFQPIGLETSNDQITMIKIFFWILDN